MRKLLLPCLVSLCLLVAAGLPAFAEGGDILIKNGTILTVTKGVIAKGDVLVKGEIFDDNARVSKVFADGVLFKYAEVSK
jgi:hypothetical protein